ncbi:protein LATE FLOWERING-like [Hibiscus syriacus]|uniref:protein LATE FLOWERING-like n=1 Tax=Hibiscus syriacus TaxID=106335 RepID=UPI0019213DDB|nr:protein LATE FLOWERING-like [Hibiscus syriacus]
MPSKTESNGDTSIESSGTSQEIIHPFACSRCPRRFPSWHALGGHQNAHKKERNEEQRLYNERLLAFKKQSPPVTIPLAEPVITILNCYFHVGSNDGPMVHILSLGPQTPVFMASGVNGEGSHRKIENPHPRNKAGNRKGIGLNLFGHEERDFGSFSEAREDGAADESNAKEEEEVDLTLRL